MLEYKDINPIPDASDPFDYLGPDYYCHPLTSCVYNILVYFHNNILRFSRFSYPIKIK